MDFSSRYTSKDADKYGQDIFIGLRKLLNKDKNKGINPAFEEEAKNLIGAVLKNIQNLNWDDLQILEQLANKTYQTR